jgi:hypothetical protein
VTVLTDVLFIWAVAVALSMVIRFFGAIAANPAASAFMRFGEGLVLPIDARVVATPYGGSFEVAAAYTVAIVLVSEWLLSVVRRRIRHDSTTA